MKKRKLAIDLIIADMTINPRFELDPQTIARYADLIDTMPPLDVFDIAGKGYVLSAGFHRLEAHKEAGYSEIECIIHSGNKEDAIRFADKSNAKNPKPLTLDELEGVCTRELLRNPNIPEKTLIKEFGAPKRLIKEVKKKLAWEGHSFFPDNNDEDNFKASPSQFIEPRKIERPWYNLHFSNARRKANLYDRLTPCEMCEYPISERCHLLDVHAWGANDFTVQYCVRCHEMFDMLLRTIESQEITRATVLTAQFRKERLSPEYGEWFEKIEEKAIVIAKWRKVFSDERDSRKAHIQKHKSTIIKAVNEAKAMGVR